MQDLILTPVPLTELKLIIAESIRTAFAEGLSMSSPTNEVDPLIRIADVCAILHVSKVTVHKWKSNGLIPFHRMGTKIYFKKSEVLAAVVKAKFQKGA